MPTTTAVASGAVLGIDGYIVMRQITGPQARIRCASAEVDTHADFGPGHDRLALRLAVLRGAPAVAHDAHVIQMYRYPVHLELRDACPPNGGQNAPPIRVAGEECGLDQR